MLIDITRLLDRKIQGRLPTGVDRVSLEYIRYFGKNATALVRFKGLWLELSKQNSQQIFNLLLSTESNISNRIKISIALAYFRNINQHFPTPKLLLNTGHSGLEQWQYSYRLQHSRLKPIFFVHDLIPITHPEYCRPEELNRHQARINTMLIFGQGIIANSATTLEVLTIYAKNKGLPLPPSIIAHLAPPYFSDTLTTSPPLKSPYFVVVGTIEPRKNHLLLLQLWRQLIEDLDENAPKLVVIGQRGWEYENTIDLLERSNILQGFVFELSNCSDSEMVSWLTHAQALLFPSFVEGYGLPLVEALALGVPVIASDLPAFREIAGDIPEYVNPLDGLGWRKLIIEYSETENISRQNQCQKLASFKPSTWSAHFQQVEALIDQITKPSV